MKNAGLTAGKKIKGRKRHIVTDITGNLLAVCVHAGNIHDTIYGAIPLGIAITKYPSMRGVCADAGYRGTFKNLVESLDIQVDISEKT